MLTDEEIKALVLRQPPEVQVAMFHLRYDPRRRFENKSWENCPSDRQNSYMSFLARQNPITWERVKLVINSLWDEWTAADVSFAISALSSPVNDWLEVMVRAYRRDAAFALNLAGPEYCASVIDDMSRQMRDIADDLQHVRYHVLDKKDSHGSGMVACLETIDDLDNDATADSIETASA